MISSVENGNNSVTYSTVNPLATTSEYTFTVDENGVYTFNYSPNIDYENMNHMMYGVINPRWEPVIISDPTIIEDPYISPVSPVSGADLNITRAKLEENIATLKSATTAIKNAWTTTTNQNLNTIQNSWAGTDCDRYVQNVKNMDKKVNNTIEALELLTTTYQSALDMVDKNQSNILNILE